MSLRYIVTAFAAAALLAACSDDDPSGPAPAPDRALLDGDYTCTQFVAYTDGAQGPGYYQGSCTAYLNFAEPTLADSGRTFPFTVDADNSVSRLDYPPGNIAYDTTAVVAVIAYPGFPADEYTVNADAAFTYFEQQLVFDFSGDGQTDTLYLLFTNQR
jgi:hypothetical protein